MYKEKCYIPSPSNKIEQYMAFLGGKEGYDDFDKLPECFTREEQYWRRICGNFIDLGIIPRCPVKAEEVKEEKKVVRKKA